VSIKAGCSSCGDFIEECEGSAAYRGGCWEDRGVCETTILQD